MQTEVKTWVQHGRSCCFPTVISHFKIFVSAIPSVFLNTETLESTGNTYEKSCISVLYGNRLLPLACNLILDSVIGCTLGIVVDSSPEAFNVHTVGLYLLTFYQTTVSEFNANPSLRELQLSATWHCQCRKINVTLTLGKDWTTPTLLL